MQVHIQASIIPRQDLGPESRHPLAPISFLGELTLVLQNLKLLVVGLNLPAIERTLFAQCLGLTGESLLRIDRRDNRTNEQAKRRNKTISEAIAVARQKLRSDDPSDPTWLAYTLWGDPAAKVQFGGEA